MPRRLVGVLGGMGPLATIDFLQNLVRATPADRDQDHIPVIVHSVPQIPDRSAAVEAGRDDPLPSLLRGLKILETCGAELVAIPCNTAHAWYTSLIQTTRVPIVHIADAVAHKLEASGCPRKRMTVLATTGTLRAGIYQRHLADRFDVWEPPSDIQKIVVASICATKSGQIAEARCYAEEAIEALTAIEASNLLLACTELPIALAESDLLDHCIDATRCLAERCVELAF